MIDRPRTGSGMNRLRSIAYPRWSICVCSCCGERVQILKVKPERGAACYKVAYYNAIVGGRHWVTEDQLTPLG